MSATIALRVHVGLIGVLRSDVVHSRGVGLVALIGRITEVVGVVVSVVVIPRRILLCLGRQFPIVVSCGGSFLHTRGDRLAQILVLCSHAVVILITSLDFFLKNKFRY